MNQCSCGIPEAQGMTHRLGQPCLLSDGAALLDRGAVVIPANTTVPVEQTAVPAPDLLGGKDLQDIDPQYLPLKQQEIVQRGQEMAEAYEQRLARLAEVIKNLSVSRDKLVTLRAALDTSINEVEALVPAVKDTREATNYTLLAKWLRQAADAAQD